MAVFYSDTMAKLRNTVPQDLPAASEVHSRVRCFKSIVTVAAQGTSDTIEVAKLPKGARFLYGILCASATMGASATLAIGIPGNTGKYRAAATFTAADTPTFFGNDEAIGVALTAEEIVSITIAVAALPGSGNLVVLMFYAVD